VTDSKSFGTVLGVLAVLCVMGLASNGVLFLDRKFGKAHDDVTFGEDFDDEDDSRASLLGQDEEEKEEEENEEGKDPEDATYV
jgi:hypothetical protein